VDKPVDLSRRPVSHASKNIAHVTCAYELGTRKNDALACQSGLRIALRSPRWSRVGPNCHGSRHALRFDAAIIALMPSRRKVPAQLGPAFDIPYNGRGSRRWKRNVKTVIA
jgi:hypothetical protein